MTPADRLAIITTAWTTYRAAKNAAVEAHLRTISEAFDVEACEH